jgi:hypothetical protein
MLLGIKECQVRGNPVAGSGICSIESIWLETMNADDVNSPLGVASR